MPTTAGQRRRTRFIGADGREGVSKVMVAALRGVGRLGTAPAAAAAATAAAGTVPVGVLASGIASSASLSSCADCQRSAGEGVSILAGRAAPARAGAA